MLTRMAFEELDAHKITADFYEGNIASARVLKKLGYVKEGQSEAYYKTDEGFEDKVFVGMTRDQYLSGTGTR